VVIVISLEGCMAVRGATGSAATWRWPVAIVAAAFGVATVVSGGRVLFGGPAAREAAGAYVAFVVWFNFAAGFAYVAAAAGLALRGTWSAGLAAGIAAATLLVFAAFGVHVAMGGAFETRTVVAMASRWGFWVAFATAAGRLLGTHTLARR
jgi:hypothetical protein